jgi:ankyrin repeat protein
MKFDLTKDLVDACRTGDLARVEEILSKTGTDWRTANKPAPLVVAISSRHAEVVRLLLENGAPVNTESQGATPLHAALHTDLEDQPLRNGLRSGALTFTQMLLAAGADPSAPAMDGTTAAGLARLYRSEEALQLLAAAASRQP